MEQLNGAFARRINGVPIRIDEIAWTNGSGEEKEKLLADALRRYVDLSNGTKFELDHVHVHREEGATVWPATGPEGFRLNEPEIRRYLLSSAEDKLTFQAATQGQILGSTITAIYNQVWAMLLADGSMRTRSHRRTKFSLTFRKRPEDPTCKPPREHRLDRRLGHLDHEWIPTATAAV